MKRNIFIILFISLAIPFIIKAEWVPLNKINSEKTPPKVTLISDDNSSTTIKIEISGFELKELISGNKHYQMIDLLTESFTNSPGLPEIPYIAKVLAIPDQAGVSIEVLETGEIQTYNNLYLPPSRESWFEGSPETMYTEKTEAYNSIGFYPAEFAQFEQPSIFRDFRITRVSVFPIRYIPSKKELQVASSITVRINYGTGEVVNPKTSDKKPIAPSFGKLYKELIFNYQSMLDKSYGGKEEGHELMLCIMPDDFVTSFQTYATWKRQSGIDIHVTKFSDIGANATNPDIIKNHITDAYHNWVVPPTYVLIVGDNGVFPHKIVNYDYSFPNDDFFVEIDGNDYFPEMMIGRFTNESDYQMQVMINKFIKYEKTPYTTSTDWFKKGICCSNDAYPSQIQTKREAANYMLNDGGFTSVDTMMSDPGCTYDNTDVITAINSGRSWLNYRGEGWSYGWWASCTPLQTNNLTSINNGQKFTFITSIGCGVAMFNDGTANCFGETWLEMGSLSVPKGAVAFVGPTSNTHTAYNNNIDRGIYKGMFQEGLETPGQALLRGKLYMYNVFGGYDEWVEYHYRVYTVLGDPSIHIWKDIPKAIDVNYVAAIPFGSNLVEFTVTHTTSGLPVANAVVCVTGSEVFATAVTDATGKAYVEITSEVQESLKVTVRGGNVIPFIGTLEMIQPTGPYIIKETYSLNDLSGGNGDGLMDYSESILMSLAVKNVGTQQANNVNVTISTTDPYITITDNFHNYGNIASNQTILASNAFAFNVAENIPDEHIVLITITAVSGANSWYSDLTIGSHAPILSAGNLTISDPGGNNNGRIDPGETVTISIGVINTGHSSSPAASAILSSTSPFITINTGTSVLGQIAGGGSTNAVFNLTCSPSTPIGQTVDLTMDVDAGFFSFSQTFYPSVGLVLEDWELGNFTRFPWTFGGDVNWAVVSADQYEGAFTARSGAIEDNESSELNLTLYVNTAGPITFYRRTSSEAGYDFLTFYIDGVQQGEWSGSVAWGQVSYPVTTGEHTFTWTYNKDGSVVAGDDCAWVDYIVFPSCTVLAPEINCTPASFAKTLVLGGTANDLLTIANIGVTPLNFTAELDFSSSSETLATVYPYNYSYGTGSCSNSTKTQTSLVKAYPPNESGWMKFDISSIPDGATINSVEFHGYVNANNYPYWSITPVTYDPITTAAATLYADINAEGNSGFYLWRNETGTIPNDWISYTLEGNVNADLQAALPQNWFAIGIMDRDDGTYFINFDGWNEANKPYLVIDYTFTPTETWLKIDGGTAVAGTVAAGSNQNISVTFEAGTYPEGTYDANIKITSNDSDEPQVMIPCTLIISSGMNVSVKAILEGPFSATAMSTAINTLLPLSQPYNASPWFYTGTESVAAMPANVVDWVLVELRDATTAANATLATRIARKAGLLLTNGNIVETDGISPLFFTNSVSNSLFVVIHHRNHLAILSAYSVSLTGENYTYDFSTALGQAYGGSPQKQLATGTWGMFTGDANGNGTINDNDLVPAWKSNAGKAGIYLPADLNFDRHVNNKDKDSYWNPNKGKSTNVPQ